MTIKTSKNYKLGFDLTGLSNENKDGSKVVAINNIISIALYFNICHHCTVLTITVISVKTIFKLKS
jgi:hypothetical protein